MSSVKEFNSDVVNIRKLLDVNNSGTIYEPNRIILCKRNEQFIIPVQWLMENIELRNDEKRSITKDNKVNPLDRQLLSEKASRKDDRYG